MPPRPEPLNALKVKNAGPGRYCDGGKLYLLVNKDASAYWLFRYNLSGRTREMGLGAARGQTAVPLAKARLKAAELFSKVADGIDPIAERAARADAVRAEATVAHRQSITFKDVAEDYIQAHQSAWANPKHRAQWRTTLATYTYPLIGNTPVAHVTTENVLGVLTPIWLTKPETAARLRGRIESVLAAATVKGLRTGQNPAQWRGHLSELLPARNKVAPVEHHAALPFADLPEFYLRLQAADGLGARALELAILTATRTGEVLGARWSEFDRNAWVWTIPAGRMKARRQHRIPLSAPAVTCLRKLATISEGEYVFAGQRANRNLSNMALLMTLRRMSRGDLTVHGFRSTFRDWAAETTGHPSEVVEMALAHAVGNKVEAAYRRGDLFEKRRKLMDDWGAFCTGL